MRVYLVLICFAMAAVNAHAQLCQGSLGDPVVNISFGAGANPGMPLKAAATRYFYISLDCPDDGFYTVRNQTANCFLDSWHVLPADHTGDPGGYFMLVNASYAPSDFYLDTVRGLCRGTTFEFAAWMMNVVKTTACFGKAITPNITFKIETTRGALLESLNTGNIPMTNYPEWKQYGMLFQMPDSLSDVVVRMTNNSPGGCGNDIALDDITFRPCGPDIAVAINGFDSSLVNVCDGKDNSFKITGKLANDGSYVNPAYQWQVSTNNGTSWNDISNATGSAYTKPQTPLGDFRYRITAAEKVNINNPICRVTSQVVDISVNPLPQVQVTNNSPVCTSDNLILNADGGVSYKWTGPNNFTSTSAINLIKTPSTAYAGKYFVTATSDKACSSSATAEVVIYPPPTVNAGKDAQICEGSSTQLNGGGSGSYNWSPATALSAIDIANPVASPADTTAYILTITDNRNCKAYDTVIVNILKKPTANAGPDKAIMEGNATKLDASSTGGAANAVWLPNYAIDNNTLLQPIVHPSSDTTYTLTITSQYGCGIASDKVFVKVFQKVAVPNAFSPNGDGINDVWDIKKLNAYPGAEVFVYNRYGQPVFHSTNYTKPWNGTFNNSPLPFGTYYYLIDVKNGLPKLSGWVMIMR